MCTFWCPTVNASLCWLLFWCMFLLTSCVCICGLYLTILSLCLFIFVFDHFVLLFLSFCAWSSCAFVCLYMFLTILYFFCFWPFLLFFVFDLFCFCLFIFVFDHFVLLHPDFISWHLPACPLAIKPASWYYGKAKHIKETVLSSRQFFCFYKYK